MKLESGARQSSRVDLLYLEFASGYCNSVTRHARAGSATFMSGAGRSSAPSVLTSNVKIISRPQTPQSATVNPEPASICLRDNGGLSDNDEMIGEEREAAFASPFKGRKRVTSNVRNSLKFNTLI
jgi:hypothetical protein